VTLSTLEIGIIGNGNTSCLQVNTRSSYIGSTQNKVKKRTGTEHASDVCKLVNKEEHSDSFAVHFAQHFSGKKEIKPKYVREHVSRCVVEGQPNNLHEKLCNKPLYPLHGRKMCHLEAVEEGQKKSHQL